MANPKVSVVMGVYNHGPFVAQAIESVLNQTFSDFEFIIADDGSRDNSREVIATFTDPRISYFPETVNRGACIVLNELIGRAKGEYIAVINSDDFWPLDKLAHQVEYMDAHPEIGAMYGRATFVDRTGEKIAKLLIPFANAFDQPNRTQGEWLRTFFDAGNCLCHPTILIRRACYDAVGLYDNRLRQLPDLDMWIRLLKRFPIHVSPKTLIYFRLLDGENTSSQTRPNMLRTQNEHYIIARSFFDDMTDDQLLQGFSDILAKPELSSPTHRAIQKALLFLDERSHLKHVHQIIGIEQLFDMLGNPETAAILSRDFGVDALTFQQWSSRVNTFSPVDGEDVARTISGKALIQELVFRIKRRLKLTYQLYAKPASNQ